MKAKDLGYTQNPPRIPVGLTEDNLDKIDVFNNAVVECFKKTNSTVNYMLDIMKDQEKTIDELKAKLGLQ